MSPKYPERVAGFEPRTLLLPTLALSLSMQSASKLPNCTSFFIVSSADLIIDHLQSSLLMPSLSRPLDPF